MASELRVNTSTNRVGLGTITYTDTGPIISGITTGNNFKTGTTNVHSTGVELVNINTAGATATFGGDLSIPDTIVHTGDTNTKIRFPAADTITAETSGNERFRIDSSGRIGLGIANPDAYFSSYNRVVMGRTNDTGGMTIVSSTTSGGYISFADGTSGNQAYRGMIAYQHNGDYMTFGTDGGVERLRIGSSGQIGIAGANYGSSGQVLTSQGSGSAVSWTTITGTTINNNANNRVITGSGTANTLEGEANLTFDGTTLQAITSGSGTREQLNLKNQNASAGTSRINFFSTVSGTEFACAAIRNGVNTVNQGRLFLQVNKGSGLTNALEIAETGIVKVTNGQLQVEGGGLGFLTDNSVIQTGSSGYMLAIQGGATYMGGRIELRGGQHGSSGDIRFFAQGATSTAVERLRITSDGKIGIGHHTATQITKELTIRPADGGGILMGRPGDTVAPINVALQITTRTSGSEAYHTEYHTSNCNAMFTTHEGGGTGGNIIFQTGVGTGNDVERLRINSSGHTLPGANNSYDLGSSSKRWRNVYTTDLQLSNEGKTNDVDGTWGNYTIQEGESDLFLINNRSGKKYKFNLTEVS